MRLAAALAAASLAVAAPARADIVRTEPGAAPATASLAPEPAAGPPLLTYAALGLAGLATVLGGSALALALDTRRRTEELAAAVRGAPAPGIDPRSAERLRRLEIAVDDLATREPAPRPPPPSPTRAAPPPDPFPAAGLRRAAPAPPPAPRSPASPSLPAATSTTVDLSGWLEALTARFAALALDPSTAAAAFIAELAPRGALAGPDGVALLDGFEGAKLWAVRAPGDGEVWALTPGEQAVLNWSAHFAPQRTQVAAEVFGEAFDLEDGGAGLRLEAPALVRRDASGRLSVRRRGRLSGFRG